MCDIFFHDRHPTKYPTELQNCRLEGCAKYCAWLLPQRTLNIASDDRETLLRLDWSRLSTDFKFNQDARIKVSVVAEGRSGSCRPSGQVIVCRPDNMWYPFQDLWGPCVNEHHRCAKTGFVWWPLRIRAELSSGTAGLLDAFV